MNLRPLPWKGEKDPYLVWLSEIILQQTRVAQGSAYYQKFKKTFPSITDLAVASEDKVLKLWQGLGYYSRARNLHETAKRISSEFGGVFPSDYKTIRSFKGVGDYTAAAIASFAFNKPYAVLDGNVFRVLSRYFAIDVTIDNSEGKKLFTELANSLLDEKNPGKFNQSIMDFGATQCKPVNPDCLTCPFSDSCAAFIGGTVQNYPRKSKKLKIRTRYFNYLLINHKNGLYIKKRTQNDIWKSLYDFPLIESKQPESIRSLKKNKKFKSFLSNYNNLIISEYNNYKQRLTHVVILAKFFEIYVEDVDNFNKQGLVRVEPNSIHLYPIPKVINCFLEDYYLYLKENKQISYNQ